MRMENGPMTTHGKVKECVNGESNIFFLDSILTSETDVMEGYHLIKEMGKELIDRGKSGDMDFCSMCVVEGLRLWKTTGASIKDTVSKVMETYAD